MTSSLLLGTFDDRALLRQFGELVRKDYEGNAGLLRHIDAIDRRKLWAKLGHPSLFDFLVVRYSLSESTAGKRIGAARIARRFPVMFDMVARGEIHLSAVHCLKAHLTPENHEQVLAQAKHEPVRQIEQLVAQLAPKPDVPSTLRAFPSRATQPSPAPAAVVPGAAAIAPQLTPPFDSAPFDSAPQLTAPFDSAPAPAFAPMAVPAPRRSPDPVPLSPGRYKLQVTIAQETRDKLKQLQDLLAHQIPNGDPAAIV